MYETAMLAIIAIEKKNNILIPDTKIKVNHTKVTNKVWPISGWDIKNSKTGINIKELKKNFRYNLLLCNDKINEIIITKKGFKISIGWNLGNKGKSSHLLDPLTSVPKSGTKTSIKKLKINKIKEILINISWFKKEKNNKITIARKIKIKCFIKKK